MISQFFLVVAILSFKGIDNSTDPTNGKLKVTRLPKERLPVPVTTMNHEATKDTKTSTKECLFFVLRALRGFVV